MVLPNFVRQAVRGLPIVVYGDGEQTRSFCDVRDAVRMMTQLAAIRTVPGEVINLGNDQEISINDLAKLVRRRADSLSAIVHKSYADAYGEHFDDVTRRRPDLTRLKSMIDFAPRWTLTKSIDDLIAGERRAMEARGRAVRRNLPSQAATMILPAGVNAIAASEPRRRRSQMLPVRRASAAQP
jgi:UDP-glucose 4-epimerase